MQICFIVTEIKQIGLLLESTNRFLFDERNQEKTTRVIDGESGI